MHAEKCFLASCTMLLSASSIVLAGPASSLGTTSPAFHSLSGEQERSFVLLWDVQLQSREAPDQHGLTRERYQQYLGDARVFGGKIPLYHDATGVAGLVIGSYHTT
jgi:hypothetical protein